MNDTELLRLTAAGDRAAFERLYERHAPHVMAFAYHLTWDRGAAEEATQETFLRVWRAAARFRPGAPLEPWLYRIARNEAYDARRRGSRRPATGGTPPVPPGEGPAEAGARRGELASALQRAVDRLSERLRLAFVLVRLSGRSQEDAARLLDVPVGTVKSRVAAAEVALRRDLEEFS